LKKITNGLDLSCVSAKCLRVQKSGLEPIFDEICGFLNTEFWRRVATPYEEFLDLVTLFITNFREQWLRTRFDLNQANLFLTNLWKCHVNIGGNKTDPIGIVQNIT